MKIAWIDKLIAHLHDLSQKFLEYTLKPYKTTERAVTLIRHSVCLSIVRSVRVKAACMLDRTPELLDL